jgi:hypothetical protein
MKNKNGYGKQLKVSRKALGLAPVADIKGGLVIEQMKRYAKRLSDHTGNSVNLRVEVWHHPASGNIKAHDVVEFILWDSAGSRFVKIQYPNDDLRAVGQAIDKLITYERATGHMGE